MINMLVTFTAILEQVRKSKQQYKIKTKQRERFGEKWIGRWMGGWGREREGMGGGGGLN